MTYEPSPYKENGSEPPSKIPKRKRPTKRDGNFPTYWDNRRLAKKGRKSHWK